MRNFLAAVLFALLSSILLAQTSSTRPTVIALPLQAGHGLKADEADLGYAVQNVIENVLLVHGRLDYQSIVGQQRSFFLSPDDLAAWVHSQPGAKEPVLDASNQNVVLRGRVLRKEETLLAEVELWDRRNDERVKRDLAIDLPALVSFRQGLIEILTEAGLAPGSKQKESMLWKEDISLPAFRLLAEGVGGDLLAGYGDKEQPVTPLEAAVKKSSQSYLVQNWLGWLHHRNRQYDAARESFTEATRINPSGIDALDGMVDNALRNRSITAAESSGWRKAEVRGELAAWQLAEVYQRAAANAAEAEHFKDAIDYYELALRYHREVKDKHGEAISLNNLGAAYESLNRYDQAAAYYEQALASYKDVKDQNGEATALGNLCSAYNDLHNYEKAIGCYGQLLQLVLEFKDRAREAEILNSVGETYYDLGQYDKAIEYFKRAVVIQREVKDRAGEAVTLNHLGVAYDDLSEYEKAIGCYEQALPIMREVRDRAGEAVTLNHLGMAYGDLSQHEKAIGYYEQALPIMREVKNRAGEVATLDNLGLAYANLSQYEKAIGYFEQALPIRREVKDRVGEATTLQSLGLSFNYLSQYERAIEYYEQVLFIQREMHNRVGEATALTVLGVANSNLSRVSAAVGYYEQALPIMREVKNREGEAATLSNLGAVYVSLSQYERAIGYLNQALSIHREAKNRIGEANTLSYLGAANGRLGRYEKAVEYLEQALAIHREKKSRVAEAMTLTALGGAYGRLSQADRATECYQQALRIQREVKHRDGEAATLNSLGNQYESLSQHAEAIGYYEQALKIQRETKNLSGEAYTLDSIGAAFASISEYEKAIGYHNQALAIHREVKDRAGEARVLRNLGWAYHELSQHEKAIVYFEQALTIQSEIKDREGEANTLNVLGTANRALSRYEKAISCHERALTIYRDLKLRSGVATALNNLGRVYIDVSQYEKAISYLEQALPFMQEGKDRAGEAAVLSNLGGAYDALGQRERAISYHEQALMINRVTKHRDDEAISLNNLATAYGHLGQYERAIGYYEQALVVQREIKARHEEGTSLSNIGLAYALRGQSLKAVGLLEQALLIRREVGDRAGEEATLDNLGRVYRQLSQHEKAIDCYGQALTIEREIGDRAMEARTLGGLMVSESSLAQASLATFYGKQSVNVYQSIRNDMHGLPKDIQQGYRESNADAYRKLAELLAAEGRIAEAEQALRLLKDEEYSEFVRDAAAKSTETLSLNSHEKAVQAKYDELSKPVTAIGERLAVLSKKGQAGRTAEESAEWKELTEKREEATARFNNFVKGLHKEFNGQEDEAVRMNEIASGRSMMRTLSDMGPGTVAVYTLTAKDRYIAFLFTPNAQISKEYAISSAELGTKIMNFRDAVTNKRDPLPLAQELYRIVVGPIEKALEGAGAKTIMWSLDGTLRYLPIAALHDGHQYMLERYQNVVFQPNRPLHATPSAKWDALALGVSKPHETENWHFPPLTNVPAELRAIIKSDENHAGALPGTEKLDEQFTWDAMVDELGRRSPTVVHIASHFEFAAGDDAASVLLLGDGTTLSLKKLKSQTNFFNNVDLLTLSACNTALTGGGQESGDGKQNGQEVDGLAITAEDQGAASVLATLWQVFDPSTSALMSKFYALHESSPTMTKAEALRQAQLALLHGSDAAAPSSDKPAKQSGDQAELSPEEGNRSARLTGAPTETRSPGKPNDYSHPYYWAPFILMGNWK